MIFRWNYDLRQLDIYLQPLWLITFMKYSTINITLSVIWLSQEHIQELFERRITGAGSALMRRCERSYDIWSNKNSYKHAFHDNSVISFHDTLLHHGWKIMILTLVILLFLALKESTSVICNSLAGKFSKSLLSNVKFFRLL